MISTQTTHKIIIGAAQKMTMIEDNSIGAVITSPPYPMIEMWDEIMAKQHPDIRKALEKEDGSSAFELMHVELDKIWKEVERVLIPGGFACINIGDATRTIAKKFQLYPNHARIISAFHALGMQNLPNILWRKQTNAPNKFMGSGMLPAGAYVTLEHEWILIFRKTGKRIFKTDEEKMQRRESAFFWEERNVWFSDLWELKGTKQKIAKSETRKRSAAYPFEIPYRLINMYSLKGDTILDPFLGTGTTSLAAIAAERDSIGYEIDLQFLDIIGENIENTALDFYNSQIEQRLKKHEKFVKERAADPKKNEIKHFNNKIEMPVMTKQEVELDFNYIEKVERNEQEIIAFYKNKNEPK